MAGPTGIETRRVNLTVIKIPFFLCIRLDAPQRCRHQDHDFSVFLLPVLDFNFVNIAVSAAIRAM